MGAQFSKVIPSCCAKPLPQRNNSDSQSRTADLSSYESACEMDPELQSFDATLQERTSRVMNALPVSAEVRSLSLETLREVTTCLLDTKHISVMIILNSKKDIWSTPDLFALVEDYFENSLQTLDLCRALENCLAQARDSQSIMIRIAVQRFEAIEDDSYESKYTAMLEDLKKLKAAGDSPPFTKEFFDLFQKENEQQVSILDGLIIQKKKANNRLRGLKSWRRVSSIIFASAFVAVLVFSIVVAAITMPHVSMAVVAASGIIPLGLIGKWFDSVWRRYEDAARMERDVMATMKNWTFLTMKDLEVIRVLVRRLEIAMESVLQTADLAIGEEEAVEAVMKEIKKQVEVFMETIADLGKQACKCLHDISQPRTAVLQRINEYSDGHR